jgi:hypothetical protein
LPAANGGSVITTGTYWVCGGVDMGMTTASANYAPHPLLEEYRHGILGQKPSKTAMFWNAMFPEGIL